MAQNDEIREALERLLAVTVTNLQEAVPEPLQVGIILVHPDMPRVCVMAGTASPELAKAGIEKILERGVKPS